MAGSARRVKPNHFRTSQVAKLPPLNKSKPSSITGTVDSVLTTALSSKPLFFICAERARGYGEFTGEIRDRMRPSASAAFHFSLPLIQAVLSFRFQTTSFNRVFNVARIKCHNSPSVAKTDVAASFPSKPPARPSLAYRASTKMIHCRPIKRIFHFTLT